MRRAKEQLLQAVETAVLERTGVVDRAARRAAYDGEADGETARAWVRKVHQAAWTATDDDVVALRQSGLDEDAIFELTVAAAVGASARGLRLALAAMESAEPVGAGESRSSEGE